MAQTAQVNININATSANKSVQDLSNSINQAGGSAQSLRAELRQVTQELQGLEPGSARFQELSQRAGQLRDRIADTSAVISATAGNAIENFGTALGNTIQLGVAGFQALSSAQVLFGVENKDLQKTLAQMGALLNLSQAIQTFGGLSDKLTEIKAGFTPLLTSLGLMRSTQTGVAVASGAAALAIEGEAVAAGSAAVATGAFAAALNALPFVAIITSLGLLVAGLINYVAGTDEASEAEAKRKLEMEQLKKAQEETNMGIAKESSEIYILLQRLKETAPYSKERKNLIDLINKTYGTTLKNLRDEKAFQEQVNETVVKYIAYQRLRFKEQKNAAKVQESIAKEEELIQKLSVARQKQINVEKEWNAIDAKTKKAALDAPLKPTWFSNLEYDLRTANNAVNSLEIQLSDAKKTTESYAITTIDLQKEIEKLTFKTNTSTNSNIANSNSVKGQGDAVNGVVEELKDYNSILSKIQTTQDNLEKQEEELYKKRVAVFDKSINLVEVEQKTREQAAKDEYEQVRLAIEKELTNRKIKSAEKKRLLELEKLNESNLTKALQIENERRLLDIKIQTFETLKEYQKRSELIILENEALQKEIRFGDGNTTDTLESLYIRDRENFIKEIDTKLLRSKYSNQIELKEFEDLQTQKLEVLKVNLQKQSDNAKQIAEADFQRQLQLEKDRVESTKDFNVTLTEFVDEQNNKRVKATVELANKEIIQIRNMDKVERDNRELQLEQELKNAEKAYKDQQDKVLKSKEGSEQRKIEVAKLADLQIAQNNAAVQLETYTTNLELSQKLADQEILIQENLDKTILNLNEEKNIKIEEADTELNTNLKAAAIKTEEDILDEKIKRLDEYLAYAQQAFQEASSLISQFAKQQQEIRTTQLEDAIAFDKEQIESQYAANLISREQYDNAIEQINQKQEQQQLQIDRKNFRTEKALSIAGATIDGARAVLGAFAGTQGGIVVRTIAAALAGVFAATQIALIARQEFKAADGGIVPGDGSGEIDSVPARLAPGEAVINSRSTEAFLPLLSAINEINGGQSFVPDLPATNAPQKFAPIFVDNQNKEPIRAYVVESDITDAQKRVARIERSTRF